MGSDISFLIFHQVILTRTYTYQKGGHTMAVNHSFGTKPCNIGLRAVVCGDWYKASLAGQDFALCFFLNCAPRIVLVLSVFSLACESKNVLSLLVFYCFCYAIMHKHGGSLS